MLMRVLLIMVCAFAQPAFAATIMVYGDSLSSGYGLPAQAGWVHLLGKKLHEGKFDYTVANLSISGETSLGGRNRIDGALRQHRPAIVILALGGNDGLRGHSPDAMRANLEAIIQASRRAGARVLLVGMRIPPNYGTTYTEKFHRAYAGLAERHRLPLVPFLLEGFGEDRAYFQPDGIHPTAAAQPRMLDTVWKVLQPMLLKAG